MDRIQPIITLVFLHISTHFLKASFIYSWTILPLCTVSIQKLFIIKSRSLWRMYSNKNCSPNQKMNLIANVRTLRQALVCTICSKYAGMTFLFICLHFSNLQEGTVCTLICVVKRCPKN